MQRSYGYADGTYLREMELQKQKSVHKQRLKAIRTRKAGSGTIDNTPPRTLLSTSLQFNPRKQNQKKQELVTIERKNKILLQRIGKILTAPAHLSVNKFAERNNSKQARILMARAAKEATIQNKNEVFYGRLKALKSYYNTQEWEDDYKKMKAVQESVMRQGRFRKSKQKTDESHEHEHESESLVHTEASLNFHSTELRPFSRSDAAHVRRVRNVKDRRKSTSSARPQKSNQRVEHEDSLNDASESDNHSTSNGHEHEQARMLVQKQRSFHYSNEALETVRLTGVVTITLNAEHTALLLNVSLGDKRNVSKCIELSSISDDHISSEQLEEVSQQLAQSIAIERTGDSFSIQLHTNSNHEFEEYSNDDDEYSDDAMDDIQPKTHWARRLLCYYGDERKAHAKIQAASVFVVGCTDVDCVMGQCTVTVYVAYCARFKTLQGRQYSTTIKLPTVARADPDLMQEFRHNLLRSLSMQYIVPSNLCTLQLGM